MSITKTFPFTTPGNYTIAEPTKAEITGGYAQCKLVDLPGQDYLQEFTNDTGFTYDNTKAEFVGGVLRQKDNTPTDETFYCSYETDIDGSRGLGTLTGTAVGGAAVVSGYLDLAHNDTRYVTYNADLNADSQQTGCIRFWITPNYSGTPASLQPFFFVGRPVVGSNRIYISHDASGNLAIYSNSESGSSNFALVTAWSPTSGTEYNIELNYDITAGATRVFIDGVQLGSTNTNTGTRDSDIPIVKVGASHTGILTPNFSVRRLEIFSTVQHTSNFTPEVPQEFIYFDSKALVPIYNVPGPGSVQSIDHYSVTDTGSTQYTLGPSDAIQFWWDGAAWSVSDQTYAQSNDAATIELHLLELVAGIDTVVVAVYFTDTNTQSNVDEIDVEYTSQEYSKDNPTVEPNEKWYIEGLESFSETFSPSGSDLVKYILKKDSIWYYWDGANWSVSDGTYLQSCTAAEIETNKATFTTTRIYFGVKAFLHSDDGLTNPQLDNISIDYDFGGDMPDTINKCIVYGYHKTIEGNVCTDSFTISQSLSHIQYKDNITINCGSITVTPDIDGYWEAELVETDNMLNSPKYIYDFGNVQYTGNIEDEDTKLIWDTLNFERVY